MLPRLAITMGDPAGIGPEVIVRAWQSPAVAATCRPVVVGHPQIMRRAVSLLGAQIDVVAVDHPDHETALPDRMPCIHAAADRAVAVEPGRVDPHAGRAAYDCLVRAARLALAGELDALVTAPLNKEALRRAGLPYPGHTEILAELCGAREFGMMLYLWRGGPAAGGALRSGFGVHGSGRADGGGLGVAHVTLHTGLASVPGQLNTAGVLEKVRLLDAMMRRLADSQRPTLDFRLPSPRLAVAAFNPHAGENGLFGDEEAAIIAPAVAQARAEGLDVAGPLPADTLWVRAAQGEFDGVVAIYHDQGHIPLKLLGWGRAVNITLGLPIVRTSPSHGTAFDIAWQGKADAAGMIEAIRVAARLAQSGRQARNPNVEVPNDPE